MLSDVYKEKIKTSQIDTTFLIQELQTHVKNSTAPYKYPRKIEFVDQLPKTISGKIKRAELRNQEMSDKNVKLSQF